MLKKYHISAVVCTYNRSMYLDRAMESLIHQDLDDKDFEIIVVDNKSTDETPQVVRKYSEKNKNIFYVHESAQGLSLARNRGAVEASSDYVAYMDDDAVADQAWLSSLLTHFENLQPTPLCIGGKVHLNWEGPAPRWFPPEFLSLFTYLDHGDNVILLNKSEPKLYLQGSNMAFRRDCLTGEGRGFLSGIGRKGTNLISGEESEMVNRLLASGSPVYYIPDAIVQHTVLPERRSRRYLIKRIIADGLSQPLIDINSGRLESNQLLQRAVYDLKHSFIHLFKALVFLVSLRPGKSRDNMFISLRRLGRAGMELKLMFAK